MHLAMGNVCFVYDFGKGQSTTGVARAVWWGLEWVRYVLNRVWQLEHQGKGYKKGMNVAYYYVNSSSSRHSTAQRLLSYARRYIPSDIKRLKLYGVCSATDKDGDVAAYVEMV
ncbi:unnamed protein product, partial [Chrysoparadoxa australica]